MSRNFQLLERVAKNKFFTVPDEPAPPAPNGLAAIPIKKAPRDPEITKLVQRLFSQAIEARGPKVVSFSGIARDDRSSWICARAGEALAEQVNASVCIVDANLVSPQLHGHVNADLCPGLQVALVSEGPIRGFTIPICGPNLWLLSSGTLKPASNPSMERYRQRFAELREAFDYVLISAPSFSRESEAMFIGKLADGIILIVEANQSRRETVRRVKEQLEAAKVQLLGAVLDQRTFPIPEKVYRRL